MKKKREGELLGTLEGHQDGINCLAIPADERHIPHVQLLKFLSARQDARAYTVYSGLVRFGLVWSGLVTVPKFLPLVLLD